MAYPKWIYHREQAPDGLFVACAEDEPTGDGWVSTPALFDPTYVLPPQLAPDAQHDLLARGGRPFVAYPAWRYADGEEPRLVLTAEADEQLDKATWRDSPAAAPPINATPPAFTPSRETPPPVTRPVDKKPKEKE